MQRVRSQTPEVKVYLVKRHPRDVRKKNGYLRCCKLRIRSVKYAVDMLNVVLVLQDLQIQTLKTYERLLQKAPSILRRFHAMAKIYITISGCGQEHVKRIEQPEEDDVYWQKECTAETPESDCDHQMQYLLKILTDVEQIVKQNELRIRRNNIMIEEKMQSMKQMGSVLLLFFILCMLFSIIPTNEHHTPNAVVHK